MEGCGRVSYSDSRVPLILTDRHVRTKKEPIQPIPLFKELIALLMEDDNKHVSLNVSDQVRMGAEY